MARPTRQGIDYFPYDVDLDKDDKLGMIIGEFGFKGEFLFIKLCAFIYKNEGYYTEWNEDAQLRFLSRYNYCGFSMSFINEVVPRFIKWGLFEKIVFDTFGVLTSVRIQETWLDACRKRKERKIDNNFWLLGVIAAPKAEETPVNSGSYTQSKVKESKGKESSPPLPQFLDEGLIYDIEQDLLKNQIVFEKICCAAQKKKSTGEYALKKFHLWVTGKEMYPKSRKALYAMFQSWLMDEKEDKKNPVTVKSGPSAREKEEAENRKKLGIE